MKTYKEKMLISLVEKYRKSRKDNGELLPVKRTEKKYKIFPASS